MLSKFILIFVICNYMRETFNVNMWKADVNYKTLFIEWQCYIFMPLVQGGCVVATFLWENHLNNMRHEHVVYVNEHGCQEECQCQ